MVDEGALVECRTLHGGKRLIRADQLVLRASAYGLVLHDSAILLVRGQHTGKYALPGGGIQLGERLEAALRREVKEEAGLQIRVERFLHFEEDFFYYDPLDVAFHGLLFFYECIPLTLAPIADDQVDDDDAEQPRWVALGDLAPASFQSHGETMMRLIKVLKNRP